MNKAMTYRIIPVYIPPARSSSIIPQPPLISSSFFIGGSLTISMTRYIRNPVIINKGVIGAKRNTGKIHAASSITT